MTMKDIWQSRTSFILASIGSAIGLGNIWRFPYVCYANGGGAFLIPYLIALLTSGIPLMVLEFSLGHKFSKPAPAAFGNIKKGFEVLGWFALLIGFGIVTYYAVVMGWCFNYLGYSFNLAWGKDTQTFFFNQFLKISDSPMHIGSIQWMIVLGLVLTWIAIIASIWKGPNTVGKVVYYTVIIPWIILIVLVIRGITLPGAIEGLKFYLTPKFSALLDYKVWLAAYSQVFFSLTIGFGVQITYASFLPRDSDVVNNAFLVSFANNATSFVGGFAVFSTLGYYAQQTGLPVSEVVKSGPHLAFVTYPTIISMLPFAAGLFGILFFLMLLTLGIDSAFSLVEAGAASIIDKFKLKRIYVNIGFGIIAMLIGIIYTTRGGLYWLDIVDHFMNNYGLLVVGIIECIAIGYFYNHKELREYANSKSDFTIGPWWDFCIKFLTPIVVGILFVTNIIERIKAPYGGYSRFAEFLGGWLLIILFIIIAVFLFRTRRRE
ncbi:sodium-dependent transporter [candidate division WOR-3 bacterium 4484_100]|uniref:Transporter n=1 Tax=candidate division WOR-3 bacterium 4484_100 TaxID=1936077 RepID=A0A1V4QDT5_UNCW3|nr:MAG: sodium-dependent transporter [candidate division WOR-3 bacterium 4484_100]